MYFPYFHDKRSELLALRDSAGVLGKPQKIVPILEPVSKSRGLEILHTAFLKSGHYGYLIENPRLLELATPASRAIWSASVVPLYASGDVFRPAFKEWPETTTGDISSFVSRHPSRPIALLVTSSRITAADIKAALGTSDCLIFATKDADRVALVGELGSNRIVEVNDRFPKKRVNADYSGEEWFSRDHLDYVTHGYPGFADYTVLPATPSKKGGGAPGAVAIHLAFQQADNSLWVEHFVSDEKDRDEGSAGSKMLEAIKYIDDAVAALPTKFDSTSALSAYLSIYARGANSSLSTNKRYEISHHLGTIGRILGT